MPVFCLTPIKGTESFGHWRASTIRPKCVWVRAESEEDARWQVGLATTSTTRQMSIAAGARSPWTDNRMVKCQRDDGIEVPGGVVRIRDGTFVPVNCERECSWPLAG